MIDKLHEILLLEGSSDAIGNLIINNEKDSLAVIKNKKIVWGQNFTNTFIFFNSKALSICKDQKNQYKALLSTIFEAKSASGGFEKVSSSRREFR